MLKRSFEALAHARSELTGGRKHTNRYYTAVRAYAAKTNQRVGDARRDATFQDLYRKQLRSKDRSVKNRALLDLGLRQKDWWWREGETPTIRLYFGTIDQAGRATAAQRADYAAFQLERGKT